MELVCIGRCSTKGKAQARRVCVFLGSHYDDNLVSDGRPQHGSTVHNQISTCMKSPPSPCEVFGQSAVSKSPTCDSKDLPPEQHLIRSVETKDVGEGWEEPLEKWTVLYNDLQVQKCAKKLAIISRVTPVALITEDFCSSKQSPGLFHSGSRKGSRIDNQNVSTYAL